MGAQITKELGVYNEEEKVCTPLGPQRYRRLLTDPRSATVGISRTPIQVECTPKGVRSVSQPELVEDTETSFREDTNLDKEMDSGYRGEMDISMNDKETSINDSVEPKATVEPAAPLQYLETDIDKLDSPTINSEKKEENSAIMLNDVRSPTFELNRTPILVECTPELFALHSRIDSLSFCDFDVHTDDPSAILSDDDQTSQLNQSGINKWLVNVDNAKIAPDDSFADSPKTVAKKQKELNALKKQLFFTPDAKEMAKPKVRTPLGNLQASQVRESPQKAIRNKQWRNIQEERHRRGIQDTENTPPNLPPLTKVSSAPGKMLERKHKKINWDEENTMLI